MTEQGSAEWYAQRVGKVTASRIGDMVAKTKNGWSQSREDYLYDLIHERNWLEQGVIQPCETYVSPAMRWGIENQGRAITAYGWDQDVNVEEVGFCPHPTIEMAGASPDGLVGLDGLVEVKCPNTRTHYRYYYGAETDKNYQHQMQWQMACTGRRWCDWVSYDPRVPDKYALVIRRFERVDEWVRNLESEVRMFLAEVERKLEQLSKVNEREAA